MEQPNKVYKHQEDITLRLNIQNEVAYLFGSNNYRNEGNIYFGCRRLKETSFICYFGEIRTGLKWFKWVDLTGLNSVTFEYVLDNVPVHTQEQLLFHLDIFLPDGKK
jgi:hypothetical protein